MSIAFQALVLLALALPGMIYQRSASIAGSLRQSRAIADELAGSLIAAAILHACWAPIANAIVRYATDGQVRISMRAVMMLAMGQFGKDDKHLDDAIASITTCPYCVAGYFLPAFLISYGAGRAVRELRQRYKTFAQLYASFEYEPIAKRFDEWKADLLSEDADKDVKKVLWALVPVGDTTYIYMGIIERIMPDEDGHPHRFVLTEARRRPVGDQTNPAPSWYRIKGDLLILRASEAVTLNLWRAVLRRR